MKHFLSNPKGAGFSGPEPVAAAAAEGLVTILRHSDRTRVNRASNRRARWAAKQEAADLLRGVHDKASLRVGQCGFVAAGKPALGAVVKLVRSKASGKASFSGLRTCGSVWFCPVCAPRIAERRKEELDKLLWAARAEGLSVVLLTLTARHDRQTDLAFFRDAMRGALKRLRERREWRALPLEGTVTAMEVTYGNNGWHPHLHLLLFLKCERGGAVEFVETLRGAWLACLKGFGLSGNQAAFDAQDGSAAGAYVQKFGAAEEVTLGTEKRGRAGSRTPWQLLDDARDGDTQAKRLWREYAKVFHGKPQLIWSNGLKLRFGIDDVDDEAAAAEAENAAEVLRVWRVDSDDWKRARQRRCSLIEAAESGGDIVALYAAEVGPTDRELWRRDAAGPVLDDG